MRDDSHQKSDATEEFLGLLGQHESLLRTYILALAVNWNDAEDLAQETRIRLWQQFANYDRSQDFGAWARSIAYYMVLAHRKTATRRRQFSEQFLTVMRGQFEMSKTSDRDRRDALACCLEKLTNYQRDLVAECFAPRATIKAVAERMGRSIRGMQQTVAHIRTLLQKCIERVLEGEGSNG